MITKAEIKTINVLSNICTVRIPYFETATDNTEAIFNATFAVQPGQNGGYDIGDIVFVAFDDGLMGNPVIIGKLFISTENSADTTRGSIRIKNLYASESASIPVMTSLLYTKTDDLAKQNNAKYNTINDVLTTIENIKTNLDETSGNKAGIYENGKETVIGSFESKTLYRLALRNKSATDLTWTIPHATTDIVNLHYTVKYTENGVTKWDASNFKISAEKVNDSETKISVSKITEKDYTNLTVLVTIEYTIE